MVALSRQSYAGFWRRWAGAIIDGIICSIVCSFLTLVIGGITPVMVFHQVTTAVHEVEKGQQTVNIDFPGFHMHVTQPTISDAAQPAPEGEAPVASHGTENVHMTITAGGKDFWRLELAHAINFLFVILYVSLLQSSKWQGTIGQMAMGMKITTENGARISWARAVGRFFASYLSVMILFIGDLMIIWTAKRQALHDIIMGTVVVKTE